MRRAKALFSSGCESRPATFAPAGSNWSSRGGNEAAGASGVEGSVRDSASMQAVVGESMMSCPRAGCEKFACPVR